MNSANFPAIVRVAMPVPLPGLFDYLVPEGEPTPGPGTRVLAPFGKRELMGIVVEPAANSEVPRERLHFLSAVQDDEGPLLNQELLGLLQWCVRYYKHPVGEVLPLALPPDLRRAGKKLPEPPVNFVLTAEGSVRSEAAPGRAKAQHRLLQHLRDGPRSLAQLRAEDKAASRILKTLLEQDLVSRVPVGESILKTVEGPELTAEQSSAVQAIAASLGQFRCHLVDGVTGSGKTEIYLNLARTVLEAGQQVLVLVPEIGLTPQLVRRFRDRLGFEPVLYHSAMAAGERTQAWASAHRGDARLIIGTRSALFLPLARPGLIVMDESHDASFKQQDGFRFSARDVAVKRALGLDVPIVLGTATPALETLHNVSRGRFSRHELKHRATGASQPAWQVTDLCQQSTTGGLAAPALDAIGTALERGEQVLVFLNRRGYAPVLLCHDCGWHALCPNCDANMTWHRGGRVLICHHCESRSTVPRFCPDCRADALEGAGQGTEQLEDLLVREFPEVPVLRVDRDQVRRRGELASIIDQVKGGESCILVGTQMLAKGHHFPRVTLVVVVGLDQALYSADFRAMERMGQLLMQVAGRAGRDQHPGTVLLQTHHPDHPALETLIRSGYGVFAAEQLNERKLAVLPPFAFQATLRAEALDREAVQAFLSEAGKMWTAEQVSVFGPFPAMMERRVGRYRWYLLIQAASRARLQAAIDEWLPQVRAMKSARKVRWAVDLDPQEF